VAFSDAMAGEVAAIRAFLFERMYRAPSVMAERGRVTRVVEALFPLYLGRPDLLPEDWQAEVAAAGDGPALARLVADYVAGMTDRFALQAWARHVAG
jgi:dGTPase